MGTIGAALKPGGYLLAFGGTRTWHRLACAIEDAGFVIQDTIAWIYGTGFPKNKALLKPAFEPIVMAYKPGGRRELQINECRVGVSGGGGNGLGSHYDRLGNTALKVKFGEDRTGTIGRWPANLCLEECDEVLALFPQSKGMAPNVLRRGAITGVGLGYHGSAPQDAGIVGYGDSGSAARFFYCAKASKNDRAGSKHPT